MKARRLALGVLLYVSADFGNPFVGGAFTFDVDTSVEGLQHQRDARRRRDTRSRCRACPAQAIALHVRVELPSRPAPAPAPQLGWTAQPAAPPALSEDPAALAPKTTSPPRAREPPTPATTPGSPRLAGTDTPPDGHGGHMADLTEQQKQEYWRYNVRLTTILLVIWFVVTYIISGLMAGWLNQFTVPRLPARLLHGGPGLAGDLRHRDRGLRLAHEPARTWSSASERRASAMSLDKIFGLYTIGFLARHRPDRHRRVRLRPDPERGSAGSSWRCRSASTSSSASSRAPRIPTSTTWPGAACPPFYNGMATGSDWMSAASFISMAGRALGARASSASRYVMGWTGGYLLLAVFLGPYLRQFGAYTIPDFLGARYGGNAARIVGVIAAIVCSFTYLDRPGHRRRAHRGPLHRASTTTSASSWAWSACSSARCSAGCGR